MYCSIILPVYNEKDTIAKNIQLFYLKIQQIFQSKSFEIIFVDNGSKDGTGNIMSKITSEYPNILCEYIPIKGRGPALARGFNIARGEYIAVLSIDRAWDEEFLKEAFQHLETGNDIVYGVKTHPQSVVKRPLYRKISTFVIRFILLSLFCRWFHDTQCIKSFRVSSIPFLNQLGNYNYFAEAEFFLRAYKCGLIYKYIPVKVHDFRKTSKVGIHSFIEFTLEAFHFRKNIWRFI